MTVCRVQPWAWASYRPRWVLRCARPVFFGVVFLGVSMAGQARAQIEGAIMVVTGEPDFYNCAVFDTEPAIHSVYIVHTFNVGSTAVRFKIAPSLGMTMTYLSETHHFPLTNGSTLDGISVCYGTCTVGDQLLVTMSYMSYGTSSPCSQILAVPHPAAQTVEAIGCDDRPVRMAVEDLWVSTPLAPCSGCPTPAHVFPGTAQTFDCTPVPTASVTWGAIKALYANSQ
jgi:hypothetical protein